MKEEWKVYKDTRTDNIRNTRGALWEVSNFGNVKRNGELYQPHGKIYYTLGAHTKLHRIVAELFIPNPENKPCIDHIDTNPKNNRIDNLRWCTIAENNQNPISCKKRSENHVDISGEKNPMYNKHHSEETKNRMSDNHADVSGEKNPMYNKHHSEETKQKMREARLKYLKERKIYTLKENDSNS